MAVALMESSAVCLEFEPFARDIFDLPQTQVWEADRTVNWLNQAHFTASQLGLCVERGGACFSLRVRLCAIGETYAVDCALEQLAAAGFSLGGLWGRDGLGLVFVPVVRASEPQPRLAIAQPARFLARRSVARHAARPLEALLEQGGRQTVGILMDVAGLNVRIAFGASGFVPDATAPIAVKFRLGARTELTATARLVRCSQAKPGAVLELACCARPRFAARLHRNPRVKLNPTGRLFFEHPLTGRGVRCDVADVSASGLAIWTAAELSLVPGMRLERARFEFGGLELELEPVVVHANIDEDGRWLCGLYIEAMALETYVRLSAIVARVQDLRVQVGGRVAQAELWRFLFESGFVYSAKYRLLAERAAALKNLYSRLYGGYSSVFQHITYQADGAIYGHVSMVKAYAGVWMVQHLAALPLAGRKTGLKVLNQILNYLDGLFRLPAGDLRCMMFYYRPDNSFPEHFFGGAARTIADRTKCALDEFGYGSLTATGSALPAPWRLVALASPALAQAASRYAGELMWTALGLEQASDRGLRAEYRRWGLRRGYKRQGLYCGRELKALLICDQAEQGLNLSEILNCLKLLVLDEALPPEIARTALEVAARGYADGQTAALIHPYAYAASLGFKKRYTLLAVAGDQGGLFCETLKHSAARW